MATKTYGSTLICSISPCCIYSWFSPHQNIQLSQKDAFGGRMKVETYCTGRKKKSEREDGGKTYGEKRERERELFWVQDPRWAFLTEWRDPDGRELLASRWLTARFIGSGFVREAGSSFFFCFEESLVLCLFSKVGFEFIVGWIYQHPQV